MNDQDRALYRALVYFDLFDYPLTSFEAWKWQWCEGVPALSFSEVELVLARLSDERRVERDGAFWFLPGRFDIIETRQQRSRLSIAKFKIAKRFARLFAYVPGIEGVAACNSLGYRNASERSDLDFFIITSPGSIWFARLFTVLLATMLGRRPSAEHSANTLCLSFFVSRDALDLTSVKESTDPYLAYWVHTLTPLVGRGSVWQDFARANDWTRALLPHVPIYEEGPSWVYRSLSSRVVPVPHVVEHLAERFQRRRFPASIRLARGTHVVLNNQMLKFHVHDRREEYAQRWSKVVSAV